MNGKAPVAVLWCICAFEADEDAVKKGLRVEGGIYLVRDLVSKAPRSVVLPGSVRDIVFTLDAVRCGPAFGPSIVRRAGVGSIVITIEVDAIGIGVIVEGLEASWFVRGEERRNKKVLGAESAERLNPEKLRSNRATVAFQP